MAGGGVVVRKNGEKLYPLGSRQTFASTSVFKGEVKLHIRRYLKPDEEKEQYDYVPTSTGIALSSEEVRDLGQRWDTLEQRVREMMRQVSMRESELRKRQREQEAEEEEEEEADEEVLWRFRNRKGLTPVGVGDYTPRDCAPPQKKPKKPRLNREDADSRGLRKQLFTDGHSSGGDDDDDFECRDRADKKKKRVSWGETKEMAGGRWRDRGTSDSRKGKVSERVSINHAAAAGWRKKKGVDGGLDAPSTSGEVGLSSSVTGKKKRGGTNSDTDSLASTKLSNERGSASKRGGTKGLQKGNAGLDDDTEATSWRSKRAHIDIEGESEAEKESEEEAEEDWGPFTQPWE